MKHGDSPKGAEIRVQLGLKFRSEIGVSYNFLGLGQRQSLPARTPSHAETRLSMAVVEAWVVGVGVRKRGGSDVMKRKLDE
jgi:hypothetical protein